MDDTKKMLYIARLTSGKQRLKYDGQVYILKNPTQYQLLILEEYMEEYKQEMEQEGIYPRKAILHIMKEQGLWSDAEEKEMEDVRKQIDDLKISLFENRYKSVQQKIIRNNLVKFNEQFEKLSNRKYALDNLSIEGNAFATRLRLLFGMCIYTCGEHPYWWRDPEGFTEWDDHDPTLDALFAQYVKLKMNPKDIRLLARTDPWSTMWTLRKTTKDPLFGDSLVCLNDEQRMLISWSNTYDFINNLQGPDKLSDFIVEDDDMLDGWILMYNKSTKRESYGTDNFGKGDEVYIPVDTIEDAKRIHEMNDPITRKQIQEEMAMIDERGTMSEMERPSYIRKHKAAFAEACRIKGVK